MSLKISTLNKDGDQNEEYIVLVATADVDINNYAIVDRTFTTTGLSNVHRHFFRFPSKNIKKDEYVILKTGKGEADKYENKNNQIIHRFYWGSDAPFWNDSQTEKAELLKIQTIDTKLVK